MTPPKINLAALSDGMPGLTPACGTMLAESAAVCLEDCEHQTGVQVQLRLVGMPITFEALGIMPIEAFHLEWSAVDEQQKRCYNDLQEATERGACGVAILLLKELTGKVVVERSKKGPGFDYWIGAAEDEFLFTGKARLEISGLLSATPSEIKARAKQKKTQIKPSQHLAPGYVAIIEFGSPTAQVEAT